MTYEEFKNKQNEILAECKELSAKFKVQEFIDKMNEYSELVKKYLAERNEMQKKGGQSKSEKKAAASRENGKKGGRPRKEAD